MHPVNAGRPLQINLTFKTLLLAMGLFFFAWAVITIRDTLLIVAVGVFLGLVFEGPVSWCSARRASVAGLAATITVIGALVAGACSRWCS